MSKVNTFETDFAEYIFNNTDLASIGDGSGLQGSATAGVLYVALFTSAPTESSVGTECSYSTYARQPVARSGAGWTVSGDTTTNAASITFPTAGVGDNETAVAVGICSTSAGTTFLYYANLDSNLTITNGVQPQFAVGDLEITES